MMTPKRTSAGRLVLEIDWTAKLGIRIDRSSETRSTREYNALKALIWQLRENGQTDTVRAFARGDISVAALKQAKRLGLLKSDTLLTDLALSEPLWHNAEACPKRDDSHAPHSDACRGAVDRALPKMGKGRRTRARYRNSLVKLRRLGQPWLPAECQVRDLEKVDWPQLRARWTVTVKRRKPVGSRRSKKRAYVSETRPASAADWNHLGRAVSRFLSVTLGDTYHPRRRAIMKAMEWAEEVPRRPRIKAVFWDLVDAMPEHAQACAVVLGATGMRLGEYLACRTEDLRAEVYAIDAPRGKRGHTTKFVAPEYWRWVEVGIPSPLSEGWIRKYFKRAAKAVGRPELRLHDLRHLYAQMAKDAGVPVRDTQAALGQKTPGVTQAYEMEEVQSHVARAVGRGLTARRAAGGK